MYFFNKIAIKRIVEEIFNVKVRSVNTYILPGKKRRLGNFTGYKNNNKRAIVMLLCL